MHFDHVLHEFGRDYQLAVDAQPQLTLAMTPFFAGKYGEAITSRATHELSTMPTN